jgi:hypothetical protein
MVLPVLSVVLAMSGAPAPQQAQQAPPAARVQRAPQAPRKLYNETADANAQIEAAVKAAAEDGIRVLVNWGANDNARCATFATARRDPQLAPKFSDEYKLVYVDVGHLDRNLDLARSRGVVLAEGGLPHFTVLDDTGKVLAQLSGRDLAVEADPAGLDAPKLAAFLAAHQAPAADAQPLFKAALDQARREDKEVFLWFAAPW